MNDQELKAQTNLQKLLSLFDDLCMDTDSTEEAVTMAVYLSSNLLGYVEDRIAYIQKDQRKRGE